MTDADLGAIWREWIRHIEAGDSDGVAACLTREYVHHMRPDEPDAQTLRGVDAFTGLIETWRETFEGFRIEIHELIERDERVVAVTTLHGRGRVSGVEVNEPYTFVTTYRDAKLDETHEYATKEEALASLE